MDEKNKAKLEEVRDALCKFILVASCVEDKTTSACRVQVLAEVTKTFCYVIELLERNEKTIICELSEGTIVTIVIPKTDGEG